MTTAGTTGPTDPTPARPANIAADAATTAGTTGPTDPAPTRPTNIAADAATTADGLRNPLAGAVDGPAPAVTRPVPSADVGGQRPGPAAAGRGRPAPAVPPMVRRLAAELTGTAFLVGGVVGSGIMAERLSDDPGLQLLQNAVATAGVLVALILALGPASGAHFNPAVTLVDRAFGGLGTPAALGYVAAQAVGGILGAVAANVMFGLPAVEWSATERSAGNLWFAEAVATLGLVVVIFGVVRSGRSTAAAFAVGAYIAGAYYFTSSTSFANPAVTVGRAFSDTFAGIAPASVPAFVVAQLAGAALAAGLVLVIYPRIGEVAGDVVVPHQATGPPDEGG